jgi:spermidine synthase
MRDLRLYVIVFISGAAVLALEILGTRILGPFYGMGLFLWSALITVTLAALSVGYAVGGRWADRGPSFSRLGLLFGAAGLWVLAVPFLEHPVLLAAEPLGLRAAVLVTATLLFAPPLTLLGMVSPYAIRLKARDLNHVGRTAGNLYAVSTVASVVSALGMGFFLIPAMGVGRLTYAIGLALLTASGLAFFARIGGSRDRGTAALLVLGIGSAGMAKLSDDAPDPSRGLLDVRQSPYAEIRVVEARGARHLLIDGGIHSVVDPATWRTWHPYAAALDVLDFLFERPGSMLLVGLGAGSIAKRYAEHGWRVDAVEIDPVVAEVARDHFGLRSEDCAVHLRDGRRFLRETAKSYDLIVVDAFGSSSIPFHLATLESFGLMVSRLAGDGVLAVNVEVWGWDDPLVASLAATVGAHLDQVLALPTREPPDAVGNVLIVGSRRALEFDEYERLPRLSSLLDRPHEHWRGVQMNHAWDNRFVPETRSALVFTDDRNPVDLWTERVNREARRELHEYFRDLPRSW